VPPYTDIDLLHTAEYLELRWLVFQATLYVRCTSSVAYNSLRILAIRGIYSFNASEVLHIMSLIKMRLRLLV